MKKRSHHVWIAVVVMLLPMWLQAQSQVLENYIQQGLAANLALRNRELAVQQSEEHIRQAKGLMLPAVSFNATYTRALGRAQHPIAHRGSDESSI
jgi:outer membrane protein TolC